MKIFSHRTRPTGFSLIEIVLALVLVGLIVGIGIVGFASGRDERILREAAVRIEAMSSRAHAMSVLHQKPFWLRIEEDRIVLAGADIEKRPEEEDFTESGSLENENEEFKEVVYDEFSSSAQIQLRRWGAPEEAWVQPKNNEFLIWQFQSTGLCEPVSFRIEKEESWIVLHMHPLTARVEEEEMVIR